MFLQEQEQWRLYSKHSCSPDCEAASFIQQISNTIQDELYLELPGRLKGFFFNEVRMSFDFEMFSFFVVAVLFCFQKVQKF